MCCGALLELGVRLRTTAEGGTYGSKDLSDVLPIVWMQFLEQDVVPQGVDGDANLALSTMRTHDRDAHLDWSSWCHALMFPTENRNPFAVDISKDSGRPLQNETHFQHSPSNNNVTDKTKKCLDNPRLLQYRVSASF